jgi:F0F1-type ATP synthase membrane subunit b/b'
MDLMGELTKNAWHIPFIMGMVLAYAWLLNKALFLPVQRLLDRRRERGREAAALAESSRCDLERRFAEYEAAVLEARRRGTRAKEAARAEMAARRDAMLEQVRLELHRETSSTQDALAQDVALARRELEEVAPEFSRIAARRILGREAAP